MMARWLSIAIAIASIGVAPAAAQPTGDKVDAKSLMQSGLKLLEAKDYLGALAVFRDAYTRFPSAKILLNIGTTLKLLKREADAANVYQRYLDASDTDPKRHDEIGRLLAEIDRSVGTLSITVTPSDSELQVGDEDWQKGLKTLRVAPGKVVLHARHEGYHDKTTPAQVAAGEAAELEITLVALPKTETGSSSTTDAADDRHAIHARIEPEPPRSRIGALLLGHFDIPHGWAGLIGGTVEVIERLQIQAAAIVGPTYGGYAGASYTLLAGRYRPYVAAGMPVFASHGARYVVRGAGGLEIVANRHLSVLVEVGVEDNLNPIAGVKKVLFIPALGAALRL